MTVHNVEMVPGKGGQICRSAGCGAVLTAREKEWAQLTMPSGEIRRVPSKCRATIGSGVERRAHEHQHRQGRADAVEGSQAAQPRHEHEPDRPPDGRRRGSQQGRSQPGVADRRAREGRQDASRAASPATRRSSAAGRPARTRTPRDSLPAAQAFGRCRGKRTVVKNQLVFRGVVSKLNSPGPSEPGFPFVPSGIREADAEYEPVAEERPVRRPPPAGEGREAGRRTTASRSRRGRATAPSSRSSSARRSSSTTARRS